MFVRGSNSERVNWRFEVFSPGNMWWAPSTVKRPELVYHYMSVSAPLRTLPIIIDLSRIVPSNHIQDQIEKGPGGVTIAVNPRYHVELEIFDNKNNYINIDGTSRVNIIKHVILMFQKVIKYSFGIRVNVRNENEIPKHSGLGSSLTLMTQILYGLNYAFNNPISLRDLTRMLIYNYGEERNGKLVSTLLTGSSVWNALKGGINIIGGEFTLIYNHKLPESYGAILLIPQKHVTSSEEQHPLSIMNIVRKTERFDACKTAYWIIMDLLPALINNNWEKVGDIIWLYQINTIKMFPPIINMKIYNIIDTLFRLKYDYNFNIVYYSAAGPTIVIIDEKKKINDYLIEIKSDFSPSYHIVNTIPDNNGIVLKIK